MLLLSWSSTPHPQHATTQCVYFYDERIKVHKLNSYSAKTSYKMVEVCDKKWLTMGYLVVEQLWQQ